MRFFSIKKIDKLLLRNFVITFILLLKLVFFILIIHTFFLLFQDIAGKGLGVSIYAKLLWYIGLNVMPDAFPVAVLVSSLIVFGHFAESYELTAMRAAGLSLQRTLRLPFIFILMVSGVLFYFQDYIHPTIKPKIFALVEDIINKKTALLIQPGVICNDIPGYSIYVDKKEKGKEQMQGIVMYDYSKKQGRVVLTTAEAGRLYTTSDEGYLVMELTNGHNYVEPLPSRKEPTLNNKPLHPFYTNNFAYQKIRISLEALKMGNTKEKYEWDPRTRMHAQLKQLTQEWSQQIEKMEQKARLLIQEQCTHYQFTTQPDPLTFPSHSEEIKTARDAFMVFRNQLIERKDALDKAEAAQADDPIARGVIENALYAVERIKTKLEHEKQLLDDLRKGWRECLYEKNHRLAMVIRCIIMFLLAAPLGCIIRRGGFGISVLISCFFMLVQYIFTICGRDLVMDGKCIPFVGAWLANFILAPFCLFFLLQAQHGMGLLSVDKFVASIQSIRRYIRLGYCCNKKKNS
ncbi:LptF/LptG family permease [Candidatus Cardinium hertigii]|uniref:YjgP/YjgQ family permease n=1 Tax=Candidatus Cardinium hertigii TaxID=247481 RepID=A0A2Z3LH85_9BACT|nr:LptF/LptG family permease [Candidatus Cardinium hertigii]AWN81794.1 hypothetical protein DK880_00469 [Candidatus Cardinium hertigii]